MSHPKFFNKLINLVHIYVSHQSRLISYILNKLLTCLKCDIFSTPLYMYATQTATGINRLKQPKNFYSDIV